MARATDLGPFRVRGVLGEGGTSIVFEVEDEGGLVRALKVQSATDVSTKERARFLVEAERAGRVSHPALVPIEASGVLPDGRAYLVMPRLDGETLAARVVRGGLGVAEACALLEDLAAGLACLHAAGLVHRDVKPENVMLVPSPRPRAVLLDFGIARASDEARTTTTLEGRVRGTPAYMAPERFFGAEASVATDVYELAVTLYVMLAATLPWPDDASASDRLDPRPLAHARADVPRVLSDVIARALSTRPETRPATVASFADTVRAAADFALPTRPRATVDVAPATTPPLPPRRRLPLLAALALLPLLGLPLLPLSRAAPSTPPTPNATATTAATATATAATATAAAIAIATAAPPTVAAPHPHPRPLRVSPPPAPSPRAPSPPPPASVWFEDRR